MTGLHDIVYRTFCPGRSRQRGHRVVGCRVDFLRDRRARAHVNCDRSIKMRFREKSFEHLGNYSGYWFRKPMHVGPMIYKQLCVSNWNQASATSELNVERRS
jgi:hypothetical protein